MRALPQSGKTGEVLFRFELPWGTCLTPKIFSLTGGPLVSLAARAGRFKSLRLPLRAQLTKRRIRTFITSPKAKNTNNVAEPP